MQCEAVLLSWPNPFYKRKEEIVKLVILHGRYKFHCSHFSFPVHAVSFTIITYSFLFFQVQDEWRTNAAVAPTSEWGGSNSWN
jgi:hypothetical protein